MQYSIEFNLRWTFQFINGISNDLQKLLRYFNGTNIFVFFAKLFPSAAFVVFPARAALYLKDWELPTVKAALLSETSSPLNCYKLSDVSE